MCFLLLSGEIFHFKEIIFWIEKMLRRFMFYLGNINRFKWSYIKMNGGNSIEISLYGVLENANDGV